MKTLDALILTFNLDRLKQRLNALGLTGMTLSEAEGVGPPLSTPSFLPRVQVRVMVPDHLADRVEEILREAG